MSASRTNDESTAAGGPSRGARVTSAPAGPRASANAASWRADCSDASRWKATRDSVLDVGEGEAAIQRQFAGVQQVMAGLRGDPQPQCRRLRRGRREVGGQRHPLPRGGLAPAKQDRQGA